MNKTTNHPGVIHPQTVEIPQPLDVHPSVSQRAQEILMQVAELLAKSPERYAQRTPCGSCCCIIGHAEALGHGESGLSQTQRSRIFLMMYWPTALMKAAQPYYNSMAVDVPASIGIARIEWFLRTGE